MATAVHVAEKIVPQQCIDCGVWFGVPEYFDQRRRQDGQSFFCPSGHSQCYTESEADRLRKKLNREVAATKLRKRAANGMCPCCTRSFVGLKRHMATKHPDYQTDP